jgi:hypothetical protein
MATVPSDAALEYHRRQVLHQLGEQQLSRMHRRVPRVVRAGVTMASSAVQIVNTYDAVFSLSASKSYT